MELSKNVHYTEEQLIYFKAYKDAQDILLENIQIEIDGLQSVADHCKDEHASYAMNKYIQRINRILKDNNCI